MPLYEYQCTQCAHSFEKLQSMSSTGADCPNCEQPAKRSLSVFAAVSKGSSNGTDFAPMPLWVVWAVADVAVVAAVGLVTR